MPTHRVLVLLPHLPCRQFPSRSSRAAGLTFSSGIVDRVAGRWCWTFEPSPGVFFYTRGNDDGFDPPCAQSGCRRGSSWRLVASSPRNHVVNVVDVVVERKREGEGEGRITESRRASLWPIFWVCTAKRPSDPTLSNVTRRHEEKLCPTALSAQSFPMLASYTLPYVPHLIRPLTSSPTHRTNTTQGIYTIVY